MERTDKFIEYLTQEKNQCMEKEQKLIAEERKDEANLCKVEANIYDIFRTLYRVSFQEAGKAGADDKKAEELFLQKAKSVPANWKKSYEIAREHEDAQKILIEETKLAVAERIMAEYQGI